MRDPMADEHLAAVMLVLNEVAGLKYHPASLPSLIDADAAEPIGDLQYLARNLGLKPDRLIRLDGVRPARERRLIAGEKVVHGFDQLLGEELAKGAGGQVAASADAIQSVRAGCLDCLALPQRRGLCPDQLILQLPASESIEGEGFLVLAGPVLALEEDPETLAEEALDRRLQEVCQLADSEGLFADEGWQAVCGSRCRCCGWRLIRRLLRHLRMTPRFAPGPGRRWPSRMARSPWSATPWHR